MFIIVHLHSYVDSGCEDGSIHLWLVDYLTRMESGGEVPGETGEAGEGVGEERWGVKVTFVTTLTGHEAPLTSLQFTTHSSSLLASGCQAGSVKIWDVQVTSVLVMEEEGGEGS